MLGIEPRAQEPEEDPLPPQDEITFQDDEDEEEGPQFPENDGVD